MTHHNTIDDRARKARIREREISQIRRYEFKLSAMTKEQHKVIYDTLKKVDAAAATGKALTADKLPDWRDLRSLGLLVRTRDGQLRVSLNGQDFMEFVDEGANV